MGKFTKASNAIGNVLLGIFYGFMILIVLGMLGVFAWVEATQDLAVLSLFWLMLLPVAGLAINWFIGHFFGDEYYNTGHVSEGRSVYSVVKTPKYYTRRMFLCFIECAAFVVLLIKYIRSIIFIGTIFSIIGIAGSVIAMIIYFIVGMSSYEQSSLKRKREEEKKIEQAEQKAAAKKPAARRKNYKFGFGQYPQLFEKFLTYKEWNSKKIDKTKSEEEMETVLTEYEKAFENLAKEVYEMFKDEKPQLTVKKTGERVKWEDVINQPYENLTYMQKTILVRLLDKTYKYYLPEKYYGGYAHTENK